MFKRFPFKYQHDAKDCGPACLHIVAKYYGKNYSLNSLIEKTHYSRKGISVKSLSYTAEELGFHTMGVTTSYKKLLKEKPLPFIVFWKNNHFIVVYKITKNYVKVSDPEIGKYKIKKQEFINNWATTVEENIPKGICLLLKPLPSFYQKNADNKENNRTSIKFLLSYLKPYKNLMFQLFIGLLIGTLLQLILPFLMQSLVDIGVKGKDISFVLLILVAQLVLFFSSSLVSIIRSWILLHISTRVNISLISDFLIKLMKLPIGYFETKMTSDIKQRIDDHSRIESFLTNSTLSVMFSFLNIIVFSIVLGIYSLKILSVFYIGTTFYIFWISFFLKKRKKLDFMKFSQASKNQNVLYKLINDIQEIKLHNAEQQKRWEWEDVQAKLYKINIKQLSLSQIQNSGGIFVTNLSGMIISIISAIAVIKGEITLGMMLSIQYIIGQLNSPIEQMVNFINSLQDAKLSLSRLAEVHLKPNEEDESTLYSPKDFVNKSIYIKNLMFQYEGPFSPKILKNINITIPEKKVTAIVGVSGSGKTTLMKILLGFYFPTQGNIFIGNNDLRDYSNKYWRENIGAVMQDGVIFSDTIANNITIGVENIDKNQLKYAAKMACIHEFIMSLPMKYNTVIGDDGKGLSQGQKQRILIARAIYKNPDFVFLDEATNALDTNTEKQIVDNLSEFFKNKTVLVIAHRLSTVKNADQIVVLDDGKIVEIGNHKELTAKKGAYYQLVKNQLELGN